MTSCFVQASGTIELYFYDELDDAGRYEAERHLAVCPECRHVLEELKVIRAVLAARPDVAAPPGGDWNPFMARLDEAIRAEGARSSERREVSATGGRVRRHAGYIAMAALLALVTLSVAYVVRSRPGLVGDPAVPGVTGSTASGGGTASRPWTEDAAFASLSEQHFARSKLVVLGLANKDPQVGGPGEWAYERELASTLLSDTRLYRLAAEERGMTALAKIMADLELVLLQASMSRDPDHGTLGQIQSLIRKRDLVTKMNVAAVTGM